jgi:hypothetical protein
VISELLSLNVLIGDHAIEYGGLIFIETHPHAKQ